MTMLFVLCLLGQVCRHSSHSCGSSFSVPYPSVIVQFHYDTDLNKSYECNGLKCKYLFLPFISILVCLTLASWPGSPSSLIVFACCYNVPLQSICQYRFTSEDKIETTGAMGNWCNWRRGRRSEDGKGGGSTNRYRQRDRQRNRQRNRKRQAEIQIERQT